MSAIDIIERRLKEGRIIVVTVFLVLAAGSSPASSEPVLRTVSYTSDRLSQFWGAPVQMTAKVFVPARCRRAGIKCAVLYHLPSYGGFGHARSELGHFVGLSAHVPRLAMAHVLLDPRVNGGYSYFTDSPNNGPWETALIQEFIPYVETLLGVGGSAGSRFLEGYSSGGWAAMWLQVSHPDFFRAVWAISPDPLDFRHFYEVDVTPGSTQNFYFRPNGAARYLTRAHRVTMKRFMQHVDANLATGGLISSYEFAWSPRAEDGLPLRLFNRADGSLDQRTLEAWQVYDVHAVLDAGGTSLRNALNGKMNIYCGTLDGFFYNEPTAATCRFLKRHDYVAVCQLVPGRTHESIALPTNLYPFGLDDLIAAQASRIWRKEAPMAARR